MKKRFHLIALLSLCTLLLFTQNQPELKAQENNAWTVDEAEGISKEVDTQKDNPLVMASLQKRLAKTTEPRAVVGICSKYIQMHPNSAVETIAQGTRKIVTRHKPEITLNLLQNATNMIPSLNADFLHAIIQNLGEYQTLWAPRLLTLSVQKTQSEEEKGILLTTALKSTEHNPEATAAINKAARNLGLEE